jgi:hypothetical protein
MKLSSLSVFWTYPPGKTTTVCTIAKGNSYAIGTANRSSKDSFEKNTGRKISLANAMDQMPTLSKKQRKNVWEAYRNMTKTPRW